MDRIGIYNDREIEKIDDTPECICNDCIIIEPTAYLCPLILNHNSGLVHLLFNMRSIARTPYFNLDPEKMASKHCRVTHQPCVDFRSLTSNVAVTLGMGNSFLAIPLGFGPFAVTSYVTKTCANMIFIKCVAKNLPGHAWRP